MYPAFASVSKPNPALLASLGCIIFLRPHRALPALAKPYTLFFLAEKSRLNL